MGKFTRFEIEQRKIAHLATIRRYRGKARGRAKFLYGNIKLRAKKNGQEFALDRWGLEIRITMGVCEVTGIAFDLTTGLGAGKRNPWAPSVDRIDNTKGYTWDNVQVVCSIYNLSKNCFTNDDVLKMALAIVARYR